MFQRSRHAAEPSNASGLPQDTPARTRLFGRSWIQSLKFPGAPSHQSTVLPDTEALPESATSPLKDYPISCYPSEDLAASSAIRHHGHVLPSQQKTGHLRPEETKKGIFRLLPGQHRHSGTGRQKESSAQKHHPGYSTGHSKHLSESHFVNLDEITYFLKNGSIPDVHLKVNLDRGKGIYLKRQTAWTGCDRSAAGAEAGCVSEELSSGLPVPQAEPMVPRNMYVSVRRYYKRENWYGKCHKTCEATTQRCGVEESKYQPDHSARSTKISQLRRIPEEEDWSVVRPLATENEGVLGSSPALYTTSGRGQGNRPEEPLEPYTTTADNATMVSNDPTDALSIHTSHPGRTAAIISSSTIPTTEVDVGLLAVSSTQARTPSAVDCSGSVVTRSSYDGQYERPRATTIYSAETIMVADSPLQAASPPPCPSPEREPVGCSDVPCTPPDQGHRYQEDPPYTGGEDLSTVSLTENNPSHALTSSPIRSVGQGCTSISVEGNVTSPDLRTMRTHQFICNQSSACSSEPLVLRTRSRGSLSSVSQVQGETPAENLYKADDDGYFLLSDITSQESAALLTLPQGQNGVHRKRCKQALRAAEASAGLRGRYRRRPLAIEGFMHRLHCRKTAYVVACFTFAGVLLSLIVTTAMSKFNVVPS